VLAVPTGQAAEQDIMSMDTSSAATVSASSKLMQSGAYAAIVTCAAIL